MYFIFDIIICLLSDVFIMIVVVERLISWMDYNYNIMLYMDLSHSLSHSILTPCGDTVKQ